MELEQILSEEKRKADLKECSLATTKNLLLKAEQRLSQLDSTQGRNSDLESAVIKLQGIQGDCHTTQHIARCFALWICHFYCMSFLLRDSTALVCTFLYLCDSFLPYFHFLILLSFSFPSSPFFLFPPSMIVQKQHIQPLRWRLQNFEKKF